MHVYTQLSVRSQLYGFWLAPAEAKLLGNREQLIASCLSHRGQHRVRLTDFDAREMVPVYFSTLYTVLHCSVLKDADSGQ